MPHATGDGGKKDFFRRVNFDFRRADRGAANFDYRKAVFGLREVGRSRSIRTHVTVSPRKGSAKDAGENRNYRCFTRSRSSACLAEFHDSRLPVR